MTSPAHAFGPNVGPSSFTGSLKQKPAGRLVLRAVVERARLVDHVRQVLRVPRREAVVPALLDVQQLVERVAVGQPRRPFLVGGRTGRRAG